MTEIPEHLLKKAAEARARLSGDEGPAADNAPTTDAAPAAAAVPAVPAAAVPEVPAEPEPEPDAPYVAAAKARKTIPVWVMPVLLFLPIWAIYYVGLLERPPDTGGLAAIGATEYSTCAGCHGGGGGGGSGRQLNDGEVTATFPFIGSGYDGLAGQIAWVANGSNATASIEGSTDYGDPDRAGGAHVVGAVLGPMSPFGGVLSVEELAAVVFHERSEFGNLDAAAIEEELLVLEEFVHLREEEHLTDVSVADISETLNEARESLGLTTG